MLRAGWMLVLVLLLAQGAANAATIHLHKPAWQWTLDERLAARFDPAAQAARELAHRDVIAHLHLGRPADVVDGKEAPELYLPTELFNHLLKVAFLDLGTTGPEPRRAIEARAAPLGFTSTLWPRLEAAVTPYLELRSSTHLKLFGNGAALGGKGLFGQPPDKLAVCRSQAEALASAKAEFGEQPFLRLLYEAVAPTARLSYTVNWLSRAEARFIEQGCPAARAS
jgi:hypothetical protein